MNFDIDKKLSTLMREHVVLKYTKFDKRTYDELLNRTIELDIQNSELERKIENYKNEMFKLNQINLNLRLELEENLVKINAMNNKLSFKEIKSTNYQLDTGNNLDKTNSKKKFEIAESKDINEIEDSSLEDLSINKDLLSTLKKKKRKDDDIELKFQHLQEEKSNLINDLYLLVNEVKLLRENMKEKDTIIGILYQEIDNFKNNSNNLKAEARISERSNPSEYDKNFTYNQRTARDNSENFTFNNVQSNQNNNSFSSSPNSNKAHLENLEIIKQSLIDFLRNFGIEEDFRKVNDSMIISNFDNTEDRLNKDENIDRTQSNLDYYIEVRMKEIKYILVNLRKINIIFKTLFMEFSKNLINIFNNEIANIVNRKVDVMQGKFNRLSVIINKYVNTNIFK